MKGKIIEQDEEWIGVEVTDNDGATHKIAVGFDGEIQGHSSDGYPDKPANRTEEGNEHVEQARRFATYYVYRERGYQTIAPRNLPEVVGVVAATVGSLSTEAFEETFGEYYQQFRGHFEEGVEPIIEPPGEKAAGLVVYLQEIALDVDLGDVLEETDTDDVLEGLEAPTDPDVLQREFGDELVAIDTLLDPAVMDIETSGVGVFYQSTPTESVTEMSETLDRPADARLELSPMYDGDEYLSIEAFHLLVYHHLVCQIRDCYLRLGLEPPENVRVLGMGKYRQTIRNGTNSLYPPVHITNSPVEGYRVPGFGSHIE